MLTALFLLCSTEMNTAAFENPIYDDGSDDKNGEAQSGYAEFEAAEPEAAEPSGYLDMEGRCDPPSFASAFLNHVYGNWVHLCFSRLAHPGSVPAQALQTMT
jgi:hypothetical protein